MALRNYNYTHFTTTSPAPFVAHVEINRASKLNTFTRDMWLEFGALFSRLSHDSEVRAVVLSGAGEKAFCAGLDVKAAAGDGVLGAGEKDVGRSATGLRRYIDEFQGGISKMEECEKREFDLPVFIYIHVYVTYSSHLILNRGLHYSLLTRGCSCNLRPSRDIYRLGHRHRLLRRCPFRFARHQLRCEGGGHWSSGRHWHPGAPPQDRRIDVVGEGHMPDREEFLRRRGAESRLREPGAREQGGGG